MKSFCAPLANCLLFYVYLTLYCDVLDRVTRILLGLPHRRHQFISEET